MAKEDASLVEMETQMILAHQPIAFAGAIFLHPLINHPFIMGNDQWERMGRPEHIRVSVWPVHADGTPWHSR